MVTLLNSNKNKFIHGCMASRLVPVSKEEAKEVYRNVLKEKTISTEINKRGKKTKLS